jgi:bacteriocin-like protein
MKKITKDKLKTIKGGTDRRICLRICLLDNKTCVLINGDTAQCEEEYIACKEACYQNL